MHMTLRRDCEGVVPANLLHLVPGRFDAVGDIAVVSLPDELAPFFPGIARVILSRNKRVCAVARKTGMVSGERRVARFELLAGTGTETVHRENGFSYRLDLADSFFAPRLASERKRVAGMVRAGERVLVPFAGVGPFAIPAAAAGGRVTAVENNPAAFRYLTMNAAANGVAGRITLVCGDAADPAVLPAGRYDRAIVPAPYGKDGILAAIAPAVRPGGEIHLYLFRKRHEIPALAERFAGQGLAVVSARRCGNVAPGVSRWAFDIRTGGRGGT